MAAHEPSEQKRILTEEALRLWRAHHEEYRNAKSDYVELLRKKEELHLPLHPIKQSTLTEFPEIELFEPETEGAVRTILAMMPVSKLDETVRRVHYTLDYDYAYCTVLTWLREARYKVAHAHEQRMAFGCDPSRRGGYGGGRRHGSRVAKE